MEAFTTLTAPAVVFRENDVDTDVIFPARFLLRMERSGLGDYLFHDRRHARSAEPFVLDRAEHAGAAILIAGTNFGCGSSREQAVWALVGAGFRCVVAPSFGDIFYANSIKNGLLPIILSEEVMDALARIVEAGALLTINLAAQTIAGPGMAPQAFAISPERREALLHGRDDIDTILLQEPLIAAFEARSRAEQPWLFEPHTTPSVDGPSS